MYAHEIDVIINEKRSRCWSIYCLPVNKFNFVLLLNGYSFLLFSLSLSLSTRFIYIYWFYFVVLYAMRASLSIETTPCTNRSCSGRLAGYLWNFGQIDLNFDFLSLVRLLMAVEKKNSIPRRKIHLNIHDITCVEKMK